MSSISGIDHVAITVADLEATCAFYDALFGARQVAEIVENDRVALRQILIGGALLSVHQSGNGRDLVARRPTVGSVDICFRWDGGIDSAVSLLQSCAIAIIEGPVPRRTADGLPSRSVYFRDPDGNLIELMASD